MKLTKRLVAVALAILMIFGSFSVSAFAWDVNTDDGKNLTIFTKILRNVNGVWTETEKVVAGENVKVAVYMNTDYYAGDGNVLLYYNTAFFETDLNTARQTLTVGGHYLTSKYDMKGYYYIGAGADHVTQQMLNYGYIDADYASTHEAISITYNFGQNAMMQKFDKNYVFCEIPLKVKADATGTGTVEVPASTTASTTNQWGMTNVSKGPANSYPEDAVDMWNWDATLSYAKDDALEEVTLYTNCVVASFDANGGKFGVGETTLTTAGDAGDAIEVLTTPVRDGYNFLGWKLEGAEDATASEVTVYPDADASYVAVWEQAAATGDRVTFRTEIHRQDENGNWVKTDKVKRGETVKARVFVDTEYYAAGGDLVAFYNGNFFEDTIAATNASYNATLNPSSTGSAAAYGLTGTYLKPTADNSTITRLVNKGYITSKFFNDNPAILFNFHFPSGSNCQVISGDEWMFEFELKVKDDAVGTGDFFFYENTIVTPDRYAAHVDIPKQAVDSTAVRDADSMVNWLADIVIESNPVSIDNTITFNANGGEFAADEKDVFVITDGIGEKIDYSVIPAISRPGYTFKGWVDASIENPTIDDVLVASSSDPDAKLLPQTMPYDSDKDAATQLAYNAFWISELDISFAVINPVTEKAEPIETITVTAGDAFVTPADPSTDGYYLAGWTTEWDDETGTLGEITGLPAVYPAEDTTYYAVLSVKSYPVNYWLLNSETQKFDSIGNASVTFGEPVSPTSATFKAPEGYVLSPAYTDVEFEKLFAEGTTMPASEYNLYFRLEKGTFAATFDANGGSWTEGETVTTTKTVNTVFEEVVVAPAAPVREGYVFAGWEPDVTIMDTEGKTYLATWTPDIYTATYYIDDEQYDYEEIEFGADFEVPADPTKEGHEFIGWSETKDGEKAELPATMPAKDVAYYAVFDALEYTLTFNDTGDSTIEPITLDYGTEIPEVAVPTLVGYTFKGWALTQGAKEADKVELPATMPAENTNYYAIWVINEHTVTWNVDGVETVVTYDYGEEIIEYTDVEKLGYEFKGWTPEEFVEGTKMPDEDLVYTAVYEANTYDAIFNSNDGSWTEGETVETSKTVPTKFNEAIVAPADPARVGYTFAGWTPAVGTMDTEGKIYEATWVANSDTKYTVEFYTMDTAGNYSETPDSTKALTGTTDSVIDIAVAAPAGFYIDDASTCNDGITIAPNGSTVVTVLYARNEYTVTFKGNEGTINGQPEEATNYFHGASVVVPTAVREGYTFAGWTPAVNLTAVATAEYEAQWTVNQYTITFDTVGGTAIAPITQDYDTAVTAPEAPTKLGYKFTGWDVAVPATMPAKDMTITATWEIQAFDATFNANGGTFADGETVTVPGVTFNEAITAPTEEPTKEGYSFKGWSTDGATVLVPVGAMDAEGKEFLAVWEINEYTITFDTVGGSVVEPITQEYATDVTAPDAPTKAGYTFAGWAEAEDSTVAVELPATMPAADKTYYAIWDANEYTITFGDTGDTVIDPITQDYDTAIEAPEDPTKEGYEFAGWEPEVPDKMPLDGAVINATWTPLSDREFKVVVHYTDVASGDKEVEFPYYDATTGNAIEIVDAIGDAADTYYVVKSDLTVNGYELDADDDRNEFTGTVSADPYNPTVLDLYYVAKTVTATFDANDGEFAYGEKTQTAELVYNSLVKDYVPAHNPTREGYTFDSWQGVNDNLRLTGDRTFQANWKANQYTITWYLDGETAEEPVTYDYDALLVKEVAVTKEGYTFIGWVDENGKAYDSIPDNMPAKNLTIIAKYEVETYTVTWNDGTTETTVDVNYGDKITAPAYDPTKTGYTFEGWTTDGENIITDFGTVPVNGVEFIAKWTANTYTLNYNVLDPATGKFVVESTKEVAYDALISTVVDGYTAPTGYALVDVAYTDATFTTALATDAKMPAANYDLYYNVVANKYDAVFNANGGKWADGDTSKTVNTAFGAKIEAPDAPALEGNTFAGWTPAVDTMSEEGMTFVANWTPNTYVATFKATPGTFANGETTATDDVVYGEAIELPDVPTREGYIFDKWVDANGKSPADYGSALFADVTFTPVWNIKQATIKFDTDGGSAVASITKNYGEAVGTVAEPTKAGYTFKGWSPAVPATMPEADLTVKAQWAVNEYTVIWNVDGEIKSENLKFGETIEKPADPVKVGYTFAGWTPEVPSTMPAENKTFTATWTPKKFNVTFVVDGTTVSGPTEVDFSTTFTAPADPKGEGSEVFSGWIDKDSGALYTSTTTMPARDVTYEAKFVIGSGTVYNVSVYEMGTDGTYTTAKTYSYTGVTGDTVKHNTDAPEGFYLDTVAPDPENNVLGSLHEGKITADGKLVLVVYYARNEYDITFDPANGNPASTVKYLHGSTVTEPEEPTREGYTFAGWKPGVSTVAVAPATYVAQWTENYYTIAFDSNGGSAVSSITAQMGSEITAPDAPTKEGYVFKGWATTKGATEADKVEIPATMPMNGGTYYAIWDAAEYTVTYYTDKNKTDVVYTLTAKYLQEYNVPVDPTKEGHTFKEWFDASTNDVANLTAGEKVTIPLGGAEYYATWTVNNYKLIYRTYNGVYFEEEVAYGTAKADIPTPAEDPTREGYTFTKWNAELPETMPAQQLNIAALWKKNSYDVTFNAGDGVFTDDEGNTSSTVTNPVEYEGIIEVPSDPTREGYEFSGWDKEIPESMPAEGLEINAVWTPNSDTAYTVNHYFMAADGTYNVAPVVENFEGITGTEVSAPVKAIDNFTVDADLSDMTGKIAADGSLVLDVYYVRAQYSFKVLDENGALVSEEPIYFEAEIKAPAEPTKEGYTFGGWKLEDGTDATLPTAMPKDGYTVKYSWNIESYDVKFDANTGAWADGDVEKTVNTEYGAAIVAPEDPAKEGYTFKGWYDAVEDGNSIAKYTSMPDKSDLVFYAIWEANKKEYTVEIYEMTPDGVRPSAPTSTVVVSDAVVGETVTADVTVPAGFAVAPDSVLNGTVPAGDGEELVLKVYLTRESHLFTAIVDGVAVVDKKAYYYDQTVEAIATPTKDGYTFSHWSETENGSAVAYPTRMPNNDVTLYAVWDVDSYNAIFDAGEGKFVSTGLATYTASVKFNDEIVAPTEIPERLGYIFEGWSVDGTTVTTDYGTMGKDGATFTAIWTKSDYTVTFYNYDALLESPYISEDPIIIVDTETYTMGETIVFPADPTNIDSAYYTFKGWSTVEDGEVLEKGEIYTQTMPAADVTYYAVYERVKVQLMPKDYESEMTGEDCTSVIDRAGLTVDDYDAETSQWYVYGLEEYIRANALDKYVYVSGDGRYEIAKYGDAAPWIGTGTVINVYDNVTGELVESFTIIIFGDVNGDARINVTDQDIVLEEVAGGTYWSLDFLPDYVHYKVKAADVNCDGVINSVDATLIGEWPLGIATIDQSTGRASVTVTAS